MMSTRWAQSLIAIVVAFIVWRLIEAAITRFFARRFMSRFIPRVATYASLAKSVTWVLILIVLALELLNIWNVNIGPALWSAGVFSVILGFGAQAMIRDLLAGMFYLFEDTFDVGDGVEVTTGNGVVSGVVEAINLRETCIVDNNGSVVSVPNGNIIFVANTTRLPSRIQLMISVPLRSGIIGLRQRITEVASRAAQSTDAEVDHVAVQLDDVKPDLATFSVSLHVPRKKAAGVASLLRETIATTLQEEGLLPGVRATIDERAEAAAPVPKPS